MGIGEVDVDEDKQDELEMELSGGKLGGIMLIKQCSRTERL